MNNTSDHDLLIRLDENVRNMNAEIKQLREGTLARIIDIEKNKMAISSFDAYKEENEKAVKALFSITEKQGKKIDRLMMYIGIGIGIILTLQFVAIIVAHQ